MALQQQPGKSERWDELCSMFLLVHILIVERNFWQGKIHFVYSVSSFHSCLTAVTCKQCFESFPYPINFQMLYLVMSMQVTFGHFKGTLPLVGLHRGLAFTIGVGTSSYLTVSILSPALWHREHQGKTMFQPCSPSLSYLWRGLLVAQTVFWNGSRAAH